jgi:hypothetical protein
MGRDCPADRGVLFLRIIWTVVRRLGTTRVPRTRECRFRRARRAAVRPRQRLNPLTMVAVLAYEPI